MSEIKTEKMTCSAIDTRRKMRKVLRLILSTMIKRRREVLLTHITLVVNESLRQVVLWNGDNDWGHFII